MVSSHLKSELLLIDNLIIRLVICMFNCYGSLNLSVNLIFQLLERNQ